ncbi:hypothetical protein [Candidatus Competibacter denitrificans]|uniref:hypothetical protein n=1 Tax=Candidatus Competibacter denitrificans TaxID=1400862 RepID=UPI001494DC55|nr:hypothetical protein [Candidatus Competibacter denitrificans]
MLLIRRARGDRSLAELARSAAAGKPPSLPYPAPTGTRSGGTRQTPGAGAGIIDSLHPDHPTSHQTL